MALDLPRIPVKNPVGIAQDPNPTDLPMTVWSGGKNVSFRNGRVERAQGYERALPPPPDIPLQLTPYLNQDVPYWFLGTPSKILMTAGATWSDVSRPEEEYHGNADYTWNSCFLNGAIVMNTGFDIPQVFLPNASKFKDLPNWPTNYRCKIMRSYKNYLVGMNLFASSVSQPTTVKWSSPADPGEAPNSWATNDATSESGEAFLADTPGAIVDGIVLRDSLVIYKEDSVYSMRHIGGVYIFQFQKLFDDVGMLAPNCAVEFDGKHFVVGHGDVYVHNGVQKSSIIEGKMKDFLFSSIRASGSKSVFVVADKKNSEIWICYQSSGGTGDIGFCDQALIWNWAENHWTIRDLPMVYAGTTGILDPQKDNDWDLDGDSWEVDATQWSSDAYDPSKEKMVFTSVLNNTAYSIGSVSTFDGQDFESYVEKTDIYMEDDYQRKGLNAVTPHISGGGSCRIRIGTSELPDSPVLWGDHIPFDIGKDHSIHSRSSGRYISLRFSFTSKQHWTFNGYTLEFVANRGKR